MNQVFGIASRLVFSGLVCMVAVQRAVELSISRRNFRHALALDSLRQITLLVEIEDRFRIRLDEDDDRAIRTVGDLVALVRRKRAADAGDAR